MKLGGRASTLLVVPSLGPVRVTLLAICSPTSPSAQELAWNLRIGGTEGWMILDSLSSLAIVAATLGLKAPKLQRRPTPIESGIVAATIGALLRAASRHASLDLEATDWAPSGLIEIHLSVGCTIFRESVRVQVPLVWIPERPVADRAQHIADAQLEIPVAVECARTILAAGEWSAAGVGDGIVFDGCRVAGPESSWSVRVGCGSFAADGEMRTDGSVLITSEVRFLDTPARTDRASTRVDSQRNLRMEHEDKQSNLAMLAAAPVEVIAEIGQIFMRADDVVALRPGSIIALNRPRSGVVELKVGGRPWATGEMVDIDGELGVRLTDVIAAPSKGG